MNDITTAKMELTVKIKQVYGQDLIYPACNVSQAICRVAGRKTLSHNDIELLKGVGFTFKVEQVTL